MDLDVAGSNPVTRPNFLWHQRRRLGYQSGHAFPRRDFIILAREWVLIAAQLGDHFVVLAGNLKQTIPKSACLFCVG